MVSILNFIIINNFIKNLHFLAENGTLKPWLISKQLDHLETIYFSSLMYKIIFSCENKIVSKIKFDRIIKFIEKWPFLNKNFIFWKKGLSLKYKILFPWKIIMLSKFKFPLIINFIKFNSKMSLFGQKWYFFKRKANFRKIFLLGKYLFFISEI